MKQLLSRIQCNAGEAFVATNQEKWTFAQLNHNSDLWASHLYQCLGRDVESWPDALPIVAERSLEYITAVLACWKLGIGVVPVATGTPDTRLQHILQDLDAQWLINLSGKASFGDIQEICFDWDLPQAVDYPQTEVKQTGIAYIIYTSGTTGKPKGCVVGIESLLPMVESFCDYYHLSRTSRMTFSANIAFDAAMMEWLPALFTGASLYVVENEVLLNPYELVNFYQQHQITFSWLPTPLAEILMADEQLVLPASLEVLQTAGQRLTKRPPSHWTVRVENAYGPTETTVIASSHVVAAEGHGLPAIGRALPGVRCFVVDEQLQEVACEEDGELLVAGAGVSRGYHNLAELTRQKFITFTAKNGEQHRAYRTGDICRFNQDGILEYINRIDKQLKVNGFRIESEEVIHHLLQLEQVTQAHIMVHRIGQQDMLVAYVVSQTEVDLDAVKQSLAASLPEYMVPNHILVLSAFPLTANHKLDEAALPFPQLSDAASQEADCHLTEDKQAFLNIFRDHMGVSIGWQDNFFQQGGNSIAAISIAANVHKRFALGLPFELFEKQGTPERLWQEINSQTFAITEIKSHLDDEQDYIDVPLSSSQRSIWFFANMDNQDRAYHAKSQLMLTGQVDAKAVAYAVQKVVDRHSIFRTAFLPGDGEGMQRVYRHYDVTLQEFDFSHLDASESKKSLAELVQEELNQPFILSQLPLVRWALVKLSDSQSALLHIEHHLVHDGWSYNLFLNDFIHYYRAHVNQALTELPEPAQYADFCLTQAQWLETGEVEKQLSYWRDQLAASPAVLNLPNHQTETDDIRKGQTLRIPLPRAQWQAVERLAEQRGETAFSIMLSLYYLMLARFSGDQDICVGSAFANRQWINADSIVGMMINTVVLRGQLNDAMSIDELLAHSAKVVQEAQQYQSLPFEYLVKAVNPDRVPGVNPLFQVFFGFHDSPMPEIDLPGITDSRVFEAIDSRAAKFDLSVVVIPREGQIGEDNPVHLLWEFKTAKYPQWLIENMIQDYLQLLQVVLEQSEESIGNIATAAPQISGPVVDSLNETVYQRFRRHALALPQDIALEHEEQVYKYADLLNLIDKKAAYLSTLNLTQGQFVGICLPRNSDCVAWMLACQACGIGYVPLDPSYPEDRINYIIEHSQINYVIAEQDSYAVTRIMPDAQSDVPWQPVPVDLASPMYCIYTSGSTGLPKGVVISYAAFNNFICAMAQEFALQAGDTWLAITSFSFDISTLELYLPLTSGAKVLLASQEESRDAAKLTAYLRHKQVTHCQATPSTWRTLIATGWQPFQSQVILCGGEAMDAQLARMLSENNNLCYNMYGPTETSVWSSLKQISPLHPEVSLGQPINNTEFYLLDEALKPVPVGAVGQLWIGGASLSDGYLHNEALTRDRFIMHPTLGQRIYQTGDLASINHKGEINFHGRADHQVKVSGYRIELEEIEQVIKQVEAVSQIAVVVREVAGAEQLVAFVNASCQEAVISQHCRQKLPHFMVPQQIIYLDSLPLTPNRKIDKKALPEIELENTVRLEAQTETEIVLADIFCQHLGLTQVDVQTHIYKLGGNSLMVMKLALSIEQRLLTTIKVTDLIELGTIQTIASFIDSMAEIEEEGEFSEELTI
ncbi:amino acid adenylation domain-containing protein [Pseudoalteromonas sp. JBTF-M23]|uniref:Amino acid adenylation domain-containing protein n=1 Tax=Pseudoalteromonas caenipelagi TaxID=2726988 RepID=A0A849VI44_9GAMM|nr:non-ribosomal peptide synthetase [Pseudoalteromonas caenipelagi]NOU51401.1 amino acid adenylation domain-containing protein [Pseudoalteromonas caenipelagi]